MSPSCSCDVLAADVVGRGPATVVDRADIDPGRLDRLAVGGSAGVRARGCRLGCRGLGSGWLGGGRLGRFLGGVVGRAPPASSSSSPHAASTQRADRQDGERGAPFRFHDHGHFLSGFTLGAILPCRTTRVNIHRAAFTSRKHSTPARVGVEQLRHACLRSRAWGISLLRELWATRAGSSERDDQEVHAEHEDPGREHQLDPWHETGGEQQDRTGRQSQDGQPTGRS